MQKDWTWNDLLSIPYFQSFQDFPPDLQIFFSLSENAFVGVAIKISLGEFHQEKKTIGRSLQFIYVYTYMYIYIYQGWKKKQLSEALTSVDNCGDTILSPLKSLGASHSPYRIEEFQRALIMPKDARLLEAFSGLVHNMDSRSSNRYIYIYCI